MKTTLTFDKNAWVIKKYNKYGHCIQVSIQYDKKNALTAFVKLGGKLK